MDRIALRIAGANLRDRSADDELGRDIVGRFADAEVYHLEPKPGTIMAAAIDWTVVSHAADIAGIASTLWLIYAEVIGLRKQAANDDQGLYIAVDPSEGLQWFLGKDMNDREVFVKDFTGKVTRYYQTEKGRQVLAQVVTEVSASEIWVRKNRNDGGE